MTGSQPVFFSMPKHAARSAAGYSGQQRHTQHTNSDEEPEQHWGSHGMAGAGTGERAGRTGVDSSLIDPGTQLPTCLDHGS